MNWLSWMIGLGLLVIFSVQAVSFHRATVCRQEAWLKSTELRTRALLSKSTPIEKAIHTSCRMSFVRHLGLVIWQGQDETRRQIFQMELRGKL